MTALFIIVPAVWIVLLVHCFRLSLVLFHGDQLHMSRILCSCTIFKFLVKIIFLTFDFLFQFLRKSGVYVPGFLL